VSRDGSGSVIRVMCSGMKAFRRTHARYTLNSCLRAVTCQNVATFNLSVCRVASDALSGHRARGQTNDPSVLTRASVA